MQGCLTSSNSAASIRQGICFHAPLSDQVSDRMLQRPVLRSVPYIVRHVIAVEGDLGYCMPRELNGSSPRFAGQACAAYTRSRDLAPYERELVDFYVRTAVAARFEKSTL
jgi:hypothetical protein